MRALCTFLGLLLLAPAVVGFVLGNSERLNPSMYAAKMDRLRAETEAIRAQTAYEEQKHQIEIMQEQAKAELRVQVLRERDARRRQPQQPMVIGGLIASSMVAASVSTSVVYHSVAKSRALSGGSRANGATGQGPSSASTMPGREQGSPLEYDPGLARIDRANISPSRITYDGLLAYYYDFFLGPNNTVIFFPKGLSPAAARFYLETLRQARIITAERGSRFEWKRRITTLDDVQARISRQAFDRLAGF